MSPRPTFVRAALAATITGAMAATVIGGCASSATHARTEPSSSSSSSGHGSLTDREFTVAVAIAQQEADKAATSITSATATVGEGTETRHNVGPPCMSGTLLHIKLIGTFNIVHGGVASQPYEPVSAVLITADPESGRPCLLGVTTGQQNPDPGATVLFTR